MQKIQKSFENRKDKRQTIGYTPKDKRQTIGYTPKDKRQTIGYTPKDEHKDTVTGGVELKYNIKR